MSTARTSAPFKRFCISVIIGLCLFVVIITLDERLLLRLEEFIQLGTWFLFMNLLRKDYLTFVAAAAIGVMASWLLNRALRRYELRESATPFQLRLASSLCGCFTAAVLMFVNFQTQHSLEKTTMYKDAYYGFPSLCVYETKYDKSYAGQVPVLINRHWIRHLVIQNAAFAVFFTMLAAVSCELYLRHREGNRR